jgi:hypothetical protein
VRHERLQTERQKYKEMMTLVASSLQDAEDEDETARRIQRLHAQVPPCSELSVRVRRDTVACGGVWQRERESEAFGKEMENLRKLTSIVDAQVHASTGGSASPAIACTHVFSFAATEAAGRGRF